MFLTKINLDISKPNIRYILNDRQRLHQLISNLFQSSRAESNILFCTNPHGLSTDLYIYSSSVISAEDLPVGVTIVAQRDIDNWLSSLQVGMILNFQLLTSPTKKIKSDTVKNSRRVILRSIEERINWLKRKADQNGFLILSVNEKPSEKLTITHNSASGGRAIIRTYLYSGFLQITDNSRFVKAVQSGVGPEKAYGLGMMLLKL